ncbi:Hypothetical predicted protein [Octopus vulgaris]|uniref:Uncharacterized protein n=1 Tax=Octopus vulgaris TaxID=6645 RepID=A0AA36BD94_OCTVU|nr:Hypothetical predicted protein [Octopus vulgaris]
MSDDGGDECVGYSGGSCGIINGGSGSCDDSFNALVVVIVAILKVVVCGDGWGINETVVRVYCDSKVYSNEEFSVW